MTDASALIYALTATIFLLVALASLINYRAVRLNDRLAETLAWSKKLSDRLNEAKAATAAADRNVVAYRELTVALEVLHRAHIGRLEKQIDAMVDDWATGIDDLTRRVEGEDL